MVKDLIERLRDWYNTSDECNRKDMIQAADLLERIYSQPVELPEPIGHMTEEELDAQREFPHNVRSVELWYDPDEDTKPVYTADQLTKAVQEATARALEAAARECDAQKELWSNQKAMEATEECADAIRNLIGRVK